MAHSVSAEKRVRQNRKRREHNRGVLSALRSQVKRVLQAVEAGDASKAQAEFRLATKRLDKAARVHVIHANEAARRKSRLASRVAGIKK